MHAYVPDQFGSNGNGKMGDDRETLKVGGLGRLAAQGEQEEDNQRLALAEFRHSGKLMSVSELREKNERHGERQQQAKRQKQPL